MAGSPSAHGCSVCAGAFVQTSVQEIDQTHHMRCNVLPHICRGHVTGWAEPAQMRHSASREGDGPLQGYMGGARLWQLPCARAAFAFGQSLPVYLQYACTGTASSSPQVCFMSPVASSHVTGKCMTLHKLTPEDVKRKSGRQRGGSLHDYNLFVFATALVLLAVVWSYCSTALCCSVLRFMYCTVLCRRHHCNQIYLYAVAVHRKAASLQGCLQY